MALAAYQVRRVDLARVLAQHWQIALFGPLLAIWSLSQARVALVVSLRATRMLFAVAIGTFKLRERVGAWRRLAAAVVFAGVLLIRS